MKTPHANVALDRMIWLGFALLGVLFLFVLWQNKTALHSSYNSYHQLQEFVQTEKFQANAMLHDMHNVRIYVADFLLYRNLPRIHQAETLMLQMRTIGATFKDKRFASRANISGLVKYFAQYLQIVQGIKAAWVEKGLNHNSGLQGRFRNSVHQLEAMAQQLGATQLHMATRLEKDILTLRRREKDYLLRLDKQYVLLANKTINRLHTMVDSLQGVELDQQRFQELLQHYQTDFTNLVNVNDRLIRLQEEMDRINGEISPIIKQIVENIDHITLEEMATISGIIDKQEQRMTFMMFIAMIVGFGIMRIVTWRTGQLVKEINRREALFGAIMETAIEGIVTIDSKGIIQTVNPATENIFGYRPGELLGQNINAIVPSPHHEGHDGYIQDYLKTGIKTIVGSTREVDGQCKDGGVFPLELSVNDFIIDGKIYFAGVIHDITERKQAKDALKKAYAELEQRVQERTLELKELTIKLGHEVKEHKQAQAGLVLASRVFENASEAIVVTDSNVNIVDVNPAYTEITGFSKEEVVGKNPSITKSGRHDKGFYETMWGVIYQTGKWRGEVWDRTKNGRVYPKWLTINAIKDDYGDYSHFIGIFSDISHIKATEERLEQLAFFDPLTNLPNRMLFRDRLNHELDIAGREHRRLAVCFIDLDRFKHVNDTLGHASGDKLLVEVAERIGACVRKTDTVARLGGDEFTLILSGIEHSQQCASIADTIIASLKQVFKLGQHEAYIGASIGIAMFPEDGKDFTTLTKNADIAMYRAKESGRGVFRFFEHSMNDASNQHFVLEAQLRRTVENNGFILFYQPKISLADNSITTMECLIRWPQEDGSLISPATFIPLAEETGLIEPMGEWTLHEACRQTQEWNKQGLGPLRVAVNLSARQFRQKNLNDIIEGALQASGLDPAYLELEVTESMVMDHSDQAAMVLRGLREMGLTISLDDFGTGYSSLSYLKQFPIHTLKIDQSFVRDLTVDSNDAAIVKAIISLAHDLGLKVVAEGVETEEQLSFLVEKGCDEVQGYLFSRPLPPGAFVTYINAHKTSLLGAKGDGVSNLLSPSADNG